MGSWALFSHASLHGPLLRLAAATASGGRWPSGPSIGTFSVSRTSAKGARRREKALAAAVTKMEVEDDHLLSGRHSEMLDGGWAEDTDSASGLRALITGRWLETEAAKAVAEGGITCSAGELLNAMAAGEDALSEEELAENGLKADVGQMRVAGLVRARQTGDTIGSCGSPSHNAATKLRLTLISDLGVEKACALLRVVTRHARLHPGIAPRVEGPVVNSEAWQETPPDEWRRLVESDGKVSSPYL